MTAAITHAGQGTVKSENGKTWVDGVPALTWTGSGQTTFCGALDAAVKPLGVKSDYTDLMGYSGLAFRIRWWRQEGGPGWCPSSPVGEFSPWDRLAARAIGYELDYHVHMDGKTDMATYAPAIKKSIDGGVPVLGYGDQLDLSVVYGYTDAGQTVLLRDYHKGEKESSIALKQSKGMLVFLKPAAQTPAAKQSVIDGLKQAVADWHAPSQPWKSGGFPGGYRMGKEAYAEWAANLDNAGSFTDNQRKQLFRISWWNFCVLSDARMHAGVYLKRVATQFEGPTRAALERAAGHYEAAAALVGPVYKEKDAFLGPWSGKEFAAWDEPMQKRESVLLRKLLESDTRAIAEIEAALATLK